MISRSWHTASDEPIEQIVFVGGSKSHSLQRYLLQWNAMYSFDDIYEVKQPHGAIESTPVSQMPTSLYRRWYEVSGRYDRCSL